MKTKVDTHFTEELSKIKTHVKQVGYHRNVTSIDPVREGRIVFTSNLDDHIKDNYSKLFKVANDNSLFVLSYQTLQNAPSFSSKYRQPWSQITISKYSNLNEE